MSMTEEMLAAYADGQLDAAERAEFEVAMAADPALAHKVAAHRALKARLSAHYAPIAKEAVPSSLAALLAAPAQNSGTGEAEVISLAAARQKRGLAPAFGRWAPIAGPALAASLVLAILQPWQASPPEGYADGDLAAALDSQLAAAQPDEAGTRILLSFAREDGDLCRAWRGADIGGIACRDETGWKIERQFAIGKAQGTEFRQAGSEAELLAAAQDMAAGEALDGEGERAARARGWKQP